MVSLRRAKPSFVQLLLLPMACIFPSWSACEPASETPVLCASSDEGEGEVGVDVKYSPSGCIEVIVGTLPIVISIPHGGYETPPSIPDRPEGTTVSDSFTQELGREITTAIEGREGERPWVVINRLQRAKLDPNRDIKEGAGGDPGAEAEWQAYHDFIKEGMASIKSQGKVGFYVDLHGQSHDPGRTQLGFSTTATNLTLSDDTLNAAPYPSQSSLIPLLAQGAPFAEVLRGAQSLGGRLEAHGHSVVPSPAHPAPGDVTYWNTGYSSYTHGPLQGVDWMATVLCETAYAGVRDTPENRQAFAEHFAQSLLEFMANFEGLQAP